MKRPGCCTLCETPVMEIVSRHTKGKLKGEPIRLGGWLANAYRVTYLLSDGSVADITLCDKCLGGDETEIWKLVVERFFWEEENLDLNRTPVQQHAVDKQINRVANLTIDKEVGRRMWKYV